MKFYYNKALNLTISENKREHNVVVKCPYCGKFLSNKRIGPDATAEDWYKCYHCGQRL